MSKRLKSMVLLAVMVVLVSASDQPENKSEKPPENKITVAVYPIKITGADKSLEPVLTSLYITKLSQSSRLKVVAEGMMDEILKRLNFANSDLCDNSQCQLQVGKMTPASKLIVPTVSKLGDKYILNAQVIDIQSADIDFSAETKKICKEDELDELIEDASYDLREKFGEKVVRPHPPAQPQPLAASTASPALGNVIAGMLAGGKMPSQPAPGASLDSQNMLGIVVESNSPGKAGVVVKSVLPNSPCKDIFQPGNIITYINPRGIVKGTSSEQIRNIDDFRNNVSSITSGASVGIWICRDDKSAARSYYLYGQCPTAKCVITSPPKTGPQTPAPPPAPAAPEQKGKR